MTAELDVYVNNQQVGVLQEVSGGAVAFQYFQGVPADQFVSLTMPVRLQSYVWARGVHPFFQMNLPEGYQKDLLREKLGPHADVTDLGLLALTGYRTIGRVQVIPHGQPLQAENQFNEMAELLASPDSRGHLLRYLSEGVAEGVSGVMPKTLRLTHKATASTERYILKTGPANLPGLAINEYLCLEVARHAGLSVPKASLSDDGEVLAIHRFDRREDGAAIGVEDFCALKGLHPVSKYKGSLEDLAKLLGIYVPGLQRAENAKRLFKLLLVNYALRNADAHLKNFAVTYTSMADVALAPVYDVVTVTAYPEYQDNLPGLTLAGKKTWQIGKLLQQYGAGRLSLTETDMDLCRREVTEAIYRMVPEVGKYADKLDAFRETGKRMLDQWEAGVHDIQPDVRAPRAIAGEFRASVGFSDAYPAKKKSNPYENPDGGFSYKAR